MSDVSKNRRCVYESARRSSRHCSTIEASDPVGLSVVGVAPANSYGYVGGIGAESINPDPVIE